MSKVGPGQPDSTELSSTSSTRKTWTSAINRKVRSVNASHPGSQAEPFFSISLFPLRLPPCLISSLPFSYSHIHLFCTWTCSYCPLLLICSYFCHNSDLNNFMGNKSAIVYCQSLIFTYQPPENCFELTEKTLWSLSYISSCTTAVPVPDFDASVITPLLSCFSLATHVWFRCRVGESRHILAGNLQS